MKPGVEEAGSVLTGRSSPTGTSPRPGLPASHYLAAWVIARLRVGAWRKASFMTSLLSARSRICGARRAVVQQYLPEYERREPRRLILYNRD
jgi:hypothetical protein